MLGRNIYSVTVGTPASSLTGTVLIMAIEAAIKEINDSAPGTPMRKECVLYLPTDAKDNVYVGKIGMHLEGSEEVFLVTVGDSAVINQAETYINKEIRVAYHLLGSSAAEVAFIGEEWEFLKLRMKRFVTHLRSQLRNQMII